MPPQRADAVVVSNHMGGYHTYDDKNNINGTAFISDQEAISLDYITKLTDDEYAQVVATTLESYNRAATAQGWDKIDEQRAKDYVAEEGDLYKVGVHIQMVSMSKTKIFDKVAGSTFTLYPISVVTSDLTYLNGVKMFLDLPSCKHEQQWTRDTMPGDVIENCVLVSMGKAKPVGLVHFDTGYAGSNSRPGTLIPNDIPELKTTTLREGGSLDVDGFTVEIAKFRSTAPDSIWGTVDDFVDLKRTTPDGSTGTWTDQYVGKVLKVIDAKEVKSGKNTRLIITGMSVSEKSVTFVSGSDVPITVK